MTKNQIRYIAGKLGIDLDSNPTIPNNVQYITISKLETKVVNININRFVFDTHTGFLKCYYCKKTKLTKQEALSRGWTEYKNFDEIDGVVYKYLFNPETLEPYIDYFSFSNIVNIGCLED